MQMCMQIGIMKICNYSNMHKIMQMCIELWKYTYNYANVHTIMRTIMQMCIQLCQLA